MFTGIITGMVIYFIILILFIIFIFISLIYMFKEIMKRNNNTMDMLEIANYFEITEQEINKIFQKLKWIERKEKYWKVTNTGKERKGIEAQNFKKGIKEPLWNIKIVHDNALINTIKIHKSLN